MEIRLLNTDVEIASALDVLLQLRPNLRRETFVETVRLQQRDGYQLIAGIENGEVIAAAGFRTGRTLMRGLHIFVDDLVTDEKVQGKGHGTQLLIWIAKYAVSLGMENVWLDSRSTATGFYVKVGFTLKNAVPCVIDAATLAHR